MVESERAEIRRDCGGVRVADPGNGGAGCDRIAQAALCGAVGLVALVQPSGRATRTDRGADACLSVFGERGQRDAPGVRQTRQRLTHPPGAGARPLISSYISGLVVTYLDANMLLSYCFQVFRRFTYVKPPPKTVVFAEKI